MEEGEKAKACKYLLLFGYLSLVLRVFMYLSMFGWSQNLAMLAQRVVLILFCGFGTGMRPAETESGLPYLAD